MITPNTVGGPTYPQNFEWFDHLNQFLALLVTMLPLIKPEKMLSINNEKQNISIGGEEEIYSDILISTIRPKQSHEDYVFGMYFLTLFLFLWILCIIVFPLLLEESSSDANEEEPIMDTMTNENGTFIGVNGEYDYIISQIQNQTAMENEGFN